MPFIDAGTYPFLRRDQRGEKRRCVRPPQRDYVEDVQPDRYRGARRQRHPNIFRVWREQGWVAPVITEQLEPERTILSLTFEKASGKNER